MVACMSNGASNAVGQIQNPGILDPPREIPIQSSRGLTDPSLDLERIENDLDRPTSMAFLGNSSKNILVTEKDTGKVMRIVDGELLDEPLIDLAVANGNGTNERGLLGMAVIKALEPQTAASSDNFSQAQNATTYVLLYLTESGGGQDGDDDRGVPPAGNRLYRYELQGEGEDMKLVNPKLLLDLPARPGPRYNGGPIVATYEDVNNTRQIVIYLMIGDLDHHETQALNFEDGSPPDGTGGILKVDINGNPLPDGPFASPGNNSNLDQKDEGMLDYYYAYGIRNGFGLTIDPVTGKLWDTENGPEFGDEINLVEPGFNSGWADMSGLESKLEKNLDGHSVEGIEDYEDVKLVDFDGRGNYSDPEFMWEVPVGVTAIKFFDSSSLGEKYRDGLFVGDINRGLIYHFDLNEDRTALALSGQLSDKVADSPGQLASSGVVFGTGFGGITDLEVGPDNGYLYVLTYGGSLYRVVPSGN
jgi:aldose sugar dehydrogenase